MMLVAVSQVLSTTSFTIAQNIVPHIITNIFNEVFFNPGNNMIATIVLSATCVGLAVGSVFLVKKAFEKYCPRKEPTLPPRFGTPSAN